MRSFAYRTVILALPVMLCLSSNACSSSSDGAAAPMPDASTSAESGTAGDANADGAALSGDEATAFTTAGGSLADSQELTTLADSLFDFDPTIDPSASAATNASNIGANVQQNLDGCGKVTVSGTTVSIDFGAPPGCTLTTGVVISGTVTLAVSKTGGTITIGVTLTSVVVDGDAIAGQAQFATSNGSTFDVTADLTSGNKTDTATLTIVGAPNEFTISGSAKVMQGGVSSSMTFANVTHVDAECYATSGTMTIGQGAISETITFDASTPSTGMVTVQIGKRTTTTTLPSYGNCPSDGKDGG